MPRIADRSRKPPGGYRWYESVTNWFPTPHASFDETVRQIVEHRQKNQHLAERHGWSLDPRQVALELDSFNTKVCMEMNWREYIASDNPPEAPETKHPGGFTASQITGSLSAVKRLAAGAALLMDWEESGLAPVKPELSEARAAVCTLRPDGRACPKNSQEELSAWFTLPVASAIKSRLQRLHSMNLTTSYDAKLNVCQSCLCPLKLKVHTPIELIQRRLKPEVMADLDPECWILKEMAAAS